MLKKIIFALGVVAVTILTVISCSKNDLYSCDPVINQWTKSNLQSIKTMTRSNWVAVGDISRQRAIYNAFTPEQRVNLWKGKIQETLELNWSADESAHLETLLTFVNENPNFFENNEEVTEQNQDNYDLFFYNWKEHAKTTLGWDDKLIYNIVYTPEKIADKEGNLAPVPSAAINVMSYTEGGSGSGSGGTLICDCLTTDDNTYRCPNYCSTARSCRATAGCGYMWQHKCNGVCL